jgi:hypothetical protein
VQQIQDEFISNHEKKQMHGYSENQISATSFSHQSEGKPNDLPFLENNSILEMPVELPEKSNSDKNYFVNRLRDLARDGNNLKEVATLTKDLLSFEKSNVDIKGILTNENAKPHLRSA